MSYNGSGTFVINSTGQPVVANTVISATVFNALTADLATGLSTAITKDGQTTITNNIPFGNNKITGLGSGTAATDAANLGQAQSTVAKLITVTGTDTITGSMLPQLTAYAAGQLFYFVANAANTGAVTINIDSLGAKSITRDGSTALAAGDINSGEVVVLVYDGTRFQMINAANSFGNTTINGTLTVTGNTGLQANVSITSALSVHGTFNVTGAAALGSTLAVTGKSDLPTVSTASMNAAVALITTGTVTNLTATGASIASANIGNLQFTAASIASINAGVAVVTNLTATSASIASANVGTAIITTGTVTNLTSTSASIASANAAVALITNGTVTNLTATDVSASSAKFVQASITSANVGTAVITTGTVTNLTSTSASVASMNAGVALLTTATVTNLTATGASVASANFGNVVTTTERVTNFSATSASIASINAAVALVTTGTVTNLTSTSASIASANLGTAVISGLTVTGASIASVNVGAAVLSGNLTLNGGTANGVLYLNASKVATSGSAITYNGTTFGVDSAAVFNDSGADVDFRIEGDTDANLFFVDASTDRIGLGTNTPQAVLQIVENATSSAIRIQGRSSDNVARIDFYKNDNTTFVGRLQIVDSTDDMRLRALGNLLFTTAGSERMRLDTSGNLGLGVTPSAWGSGRVALQIGGTPYIVGPNLDIGSNFYVDSVGYKYATTGVASRFDQSAGAHRWFTAPSGTAGNAITFTQAMTLDASGNLGVGTTSPSNKLHVKGGSFNQAILDNAGEQYTALQFYNNGVTKTDLYFDNTGTTFNIRTRVAAPLIFLTADVERARIATDGTVYVGCTSDPNASVNGVAILANGEIDISRSSGTSGIFNRNTTDGDIISFRQDNTEEGTISVSGNTISYNAFAGSHWSQLQDGSKPDILRGTVMESINELCEWPSEQNERLPKSKVSDTAGSKKVYGVFMAWDNDWTATNDMLVTAVGAFICRVNASVTVQEGDLLESNGDGTARVQADDIIRSSTIGKVTSTVKTHQYDDGSYCVPTVLYCG